MQPGLPRLSPVKRLALLTLAAVQPSKPRGVVSKGIAFTWRAAGQFCVEYDEYRSGVGFGGFDVEVANGLKDLSERFGKVKRNG